MKTIIDLIQKRRSCRSFLPQFIPEDVLKSILKASLLAPSSKNSRPWEFVIIENKEVIQKLSECKPHGAAFLCKAPMAIVILANPLKSDVWIEDCSIATILMQLAAEDLGLGSTWIQVRNRMHNDKVNASDYIKGLINAPEHIEVAAILALGFKEKERAPYSEEDLLWEKVHREQF